MDETPEQTLLRISRQIEELSRNVSELMVRQNATDGQVNHLLSQQASAGPPAHGTNGAGPPGFPDEPAGRSGLRKSTTETGWKAIRYRKVYMEMVPEYDGKAANWSGFMMKLRLTLDQAYEWAPLYLRMSSQLEATPTREQLVAWIEQDSVGYDRTDLVEFGKDLWSVLCNRVTAGSGPASVIHRVMESENGWMRGPVALYDIQRDGIGRAVDRRAELNRRVHNPNSVRRWEEVPGAINSWESTVSEYVAITGQSPSEETKMNSLLRLLPKTLYELTVTQYGISTYPQMRSYVQTQCTRARFGQHGHGTGSQSKESGEPTPMDMVL